MTIALYPLCVFLADRAAFSILSVFSLRASYTSILPNFAFHRVGDSFNGRTADSDSGNHGSNPGPSSDGSSNVFRRNSPPDIDASDATAAGRAGKAADAFS
jgi:hypothetical protein